MRLLLAVFALALPAVPACSCSQDLGFDGDAGVDAPSAPLDVGTDVPLVTDAPDAASVDAPPGVGFDAPRADTSPCPQDGTTTTTYELGHCFTLENCCTDAECDPGFACNRLGHCVAAETWCGCVDGSCVPGAECLNNETVCGICVFPTTSCTDGSECMPGFRCESGHCFDAMEACVTPRLGPP